MKQRSRIFTVRVSWSSLWLNAGYIWSLVPQVITDRGGSIECLHLEMYNACMQYTIRNVPKQVDAVLRQKAKAERKSLNQVAVDALKAATGLSGKPLRRRDLSDIAGTWIKDPAVEAALRDQDRIDPEAWK